MKFSIIVKVLQVILTTSYINLSQEQFQNIAYLKHTHTHAFTRTDTDRQTDNKSIATPKTVLGRDVKLAGYFIGKLFKVLAWRWTANGGFRGLNKRV